MFFVLVRTWCCIELDRSRGNRVRVHQTGLIFATHPWTYSISSVN